MPDTLQRERERQHAWDQLSALFAAPTRAFSIHYALQRLRRDPSDASPPVAAVALRNVGTGERTVFSIKGEASSAGIDLGAPVLPTQLLQLEYSLLFRFNDFLARHLDHLLVHWYMRNEWFGFQALEARYRKVLSEVAQGIYGARSAASAVPFGFGARPAPYPIHFPDRQRVDLALVLSQVYGYGPVRLRELANRNNLSHAELIEGINEPVAFAVGNHARLEWSSATKARLIAELAGLAYAGTIRPGREVAPDKGSDALRVFINYRREDTEAAANWLHELLSAEFGDDNVFIDTDDIPVGIDFEQFLRDQIDACDVFLAMIGRGWSGAADEAGRSRLADPSDFVRREIRAALLRGIPVIPVLIEGVRMPSLAQLPEDLHPLIKRQGVELRSREFRQDVAALIPKIRGAHRVGRRVPVGRSG